MSYKEKLKDVSRIAFGIGIAVAAAIAIILFAGESSRTNNTFSSSDRYKEYKKHHRGETSRKPTEWFTLSRAYPYSDIPFDAYKRAMERATAIRNATITKDNFPSVMAGPSNVGGRITAVAVNPNDNDIIYAGAALGGVFKTTDGGDSWTPISDEVPSLSVGALAMDPYNPDILYFGTGEANSSGDSYSGTGIYKTTDGGLSWQFKGLPNSRHIGRIAINPLLNNVVFVAVMGSLFSTNIDRGVYRSTDSGDSWEKVLYVSDSTGAIDVAINPSNPDIVFAAMWERIRGTTERRVGGLNSGIWRSTDGGNNWDKLSNGLPPDAADNGRIGLAISPSNPNTIYACYYDHPGYLMGIWQSTDGGDSWQSKLVSPDPSNFSSFGWYFGQIWVHPTNSNTVYLGDVDFWRSTDGGAHWQSIIGNMHVDHHALYQDPNNPNFMVNGNDGGIFISTNAGSSWTKSYDLPITQFYAMTIDPQLPHRLYGGTQDNSTPRTLDGSIDNWDVIFYGDGFYTNIDFTNSNVIYAEAQYGFLGKATDMGYDWNIILTGDDIGERTNWCTPVVMSPHDNRTLYYGAQKIYQTTNGGTSWTAISPDLTGGSGGGNLVYGTITTISPSPLISDIIWAGTDDSRVWVTTDGGSSWERVDALLPERWCTRVTADVFDIGTAYATFSGYKADDWLPHIFKTTDYGVTWENISGNLVDIPVNDILPDPQKQGRLYIGTDFGMYYTDDGGQVWQAMGSDMSLCPVFDIDLHNESRILVAGTHGRSMYSYDITLTGVGENNTHPIAGYQLHQNYPNPFNATTIIPVDISQAGHVALRVYDVNGRLVSTLLDGEISAGRHNVKFDGADLASGTYFATMRAGEYHISQRMMLIK